MNPFDHIERLPACDLCGADVVECGARVAAGRQVLLGVPVAISTVACPRCRFIFQPERFSGTLLKALYEKDTSFSFGEVEEDMPIIRTGLAERQEVISRAMRAYGIAESAVVLDVGGGRGECCQHLVQRHRVVVSDTTECAPVDPRIVKVPELFSADLENGSFDVVVMNHVLEHVFSPTLLLTSAHSALKDGGILIAEVPFELYTPLVARHLGDWRHVGYFCRTTLRQFLEKSGFTVERIVLEEGCYGARRLPVVRAVARKTASLPARHPICNSSRVLVVDMLAPVVLVSLANRILARR